MPRNPIRRRARLWCWLVLLHALLGCDGPHAVPAGDADGGGDAGRNAGDADIADGSDSDAKDPDKGRASTGGSGKGGNAKDGGGDDGDDGEDGDDGDDDGDDETPNDAGVDAGDASIVPSTPFHARVLATGYAHACAIGSDGGLYCWGQNSFGQLGVDDTDERATPTRVGDASDWTAVSAGRYHTCAIRAGALYCWGANGFAQLAIGDAEIEEQHTPLLIDGTDHVWSAVSAGDWHTCALDDAGAVYCWGYDLLGRLGIGKGLGDSDDPGESIATPTAVDDGAHYVAIEAGASHTCGVRDDGELWCWGLADHGQLGAEAPDECELNAVPTPCSLSPLRVGDAENWASVSAGGAHTCALTDADALFCFGDNQFGQLGTGDEVAAASPAEVEGSYLAASAGATHTCALRADAELVCFGSNESDQLGFEAAAANQPHAVASDEDFESVSTSALCTCAVANDGVGFCWGTCAYSMHSTPSRVVTM